MTLTVDTASFVTAAQVDQQLLTSAAFKTSYMPRGLRRVVGFRLGDHNCHPTCFYVDSAASTDLHIHGGVIT